jgi:hypothetical protein
VVSQDLVVFTTAGPSKIVLKAPQMEFRGVQGSSVKKSYADSTLWSADVGTVQCVLNLYLFLFLRVSCCVVLCFVVSGSIEDRAYCVGYIIEFSMGQEGFIVVAVCVSAA